jgi:hypothetical protein
MKVEGLQAYKSLNTQNLNYLRLKGQNHMRIIKILLGITLLLSLTALAFAQDTLTVGKKGMVTFTSNVKAGETTLKAGMYHVQHVVEGSNHLFVFKAVSMPAGYRENQMVETKEVVRLNCTVEPTAKKTRNTKIKLGTNAAGEKVIEEIQVAGESVKHKF